MISRKAKKLVIKPSQMLIRSGFVEKETIASEANLTIFRRPYLLVPEKRFPASKAMVVEGNPSHCTAPRINNSVSLKPSKASTTQRSRRRKSELPSEISTSARLEKTL